ITATDAAGNSSTGTASVYVSKGNKSSANSRTEYVTEAEAWEGIPEGLKAKVLPNPSTGYFTLLLQSRSNEVVQLRVSDAGGRLIENKRGLLANGRFEVGHTYRPGVYHAELVQGNQHILLKLVKQ
ncbi:MAG TPA: T9SS type A sorting domain-containing protein, partial [Flavisolibacter sp.]|nr:T9SS type A sorting domain-containing protein [Flavisolibacter sp.]